MIKLYKYLNALILLSIIVLSSCTEDPEPGLDILIEPSTTPPHINSITPLDSVLGGVTILTVTGTDLPTVLDANSSITFNGVKGTILETSATQMKVLPPIIASDSVKIKIQKFQVEDFSNVVIKKIEAAQEEYFNESNNSVEPFALTIDDAENLYVSVNNKGIYKIDNQKNVTIFAPNNTAAAFFRSMTIGSDNAIYGVKGGVRGIYKVVENTAAAAFVSSSQGIADNVNSVNFDKTNNVIWAGGATGIIYRVTLDKNVKKYNITGRVNALRVAHNNLFVASTTNGDELIWKIPIISADSLGTPEVHFNFSTSVDSSRSIVDLLIGEDGKIYIATSETSNKSDLIYVLNTNNTVEFLYPGIFNVIPYSLVWGNDQYVYMSDIVDSKNNAIIRIKMQKLGAN